ncbi:MAG: protein kinase domain-containing protein [Thermoguttaceae bacterium]
MAQAPPPSVALWRLAERLRPGQPCDVRIGLRVVQGVARQVHALHENGRIHRGISPLSIALNERTEPVLSAPGGPRCFGGSESDPEFCPPPLGGPRPVEIPVEMAAAAETLQRHGCGLEPRQIDIYQLGALLCRLLSGEPVLAYMYSPTAKGKVLAAARPLLERALGFDCQNRFADCRALVEAIDEVLGSLPAGPENRPSSVGPPPSTTRAGLDAATSPARAPASGLGPLPQESTGLPFQRLGHFRIVRRIGQGGMGDVYEGYDESLDRRVAVKVLPAALAREEDFVLRFHAEAAAAAKIDHPNVVPIYFIGEESGHHYFAMQFVDGESLAQRLARQPRLPLEEALELAAQCLAGLSAAHARGIIHRDVKPANILIDGETGRAMLADFGLVRRMDAATRMTATGLVLGTLDYIAPEQARGQAVDGRADLYALGVVVYQMLAGRLPFTADTPTAMLFQHAYEKPFPLRTAALGLPEPLVRIVERLLAKDLEQRYQDCGGVLSDLRALRQGPGPGEPHGWRPGNPFAGPLPSPSPSAPDVPWQRWRDWAATMFRRHAPPALQDLQSTTQQADGAVAHCERRRNHLAKLLAEAESIAADLDEQLLAHREAARIAVRRAESAVAEDEVQTALVRKQRSDDEAAALEAVRREQEDDLENLRLELAKAEAELAKLRTQRDLMQARLHAAQANLAVEGGVPRRGFRRWLIAAAVGTGSVVGVLLLTAYIMTHRPPANLDGPADSPTLPPAAVSAAAGPPPAPNVERDPAPPVVRQSGQVPEGAAIVKTTGAAPISPASASGPRPRRSRTSARAEEGAIGAVTSDAEIVRFSKMGWGVTSLAFSASGNRLAAGKMDRAVMVFDVAKPARVSFIDRLEGLGQVTCVAFTPDGRKLLTGGERGRIQVWDVASDGHLSEVTRFPPSWWTARNGEDVASDGRLSAAARFDGHASAVHAIAISADGQRVLSGGDEKKARLWDLAGGSERLVMDGFRGSVKAARFTRDDQEGIASDGETLAVIDIKQGKTVRSLPLARFRAQAVAISPDGSRIAVSELYAIRLWDCRTGQEFPRLQDTEIQWTAAFSSNGKYLVSGGQGKVNVWQLATQRRIAQFDTVGSYYVQSIAVSPGGRYVAAIPASAGQDLQVFRLPAEVAGE